MRVVIAPDSFKGSLSAFDAACAMERGLRRVFPYAEVDLVPIADGGEGTVEALVEATGGTRQYENVLDPLGRSIKAVWGLLGGGNSAVVEMAAASGLPLLQPHERDPFSTSTYGTGELIVAALEALHAACNPSCKPRLIIGIGGSATNDGGAGAIRALGGRFLSVSGKELTEGGGALQALDKVVLDGLHPLLEETEILVACDVKNPLCGPEGASAVFGPQKGADATAVALLDAALGHYATVCAKTTGRLCATIPGAGAAGGLGAGLLFFTPAKLMPGVELVLEATNFSARVADADMVLTGEGCTDFQTCFGKAPVGVATMAKQYGKAVYCISGCLGEGAERVLSCGIDALSAVAGEAVPAEESMSNAAPLLGSVYTSLCQNFQPKRDATNLHCSSKC